MPTLDLVPELRLVRLTANDAVKLAGYYVDRGIYRFGGGADALDRHDPFDERGACDCSSFTAWVTGHARSQPALGMSFNTTAIVDDLKGDRRLYIPVSPSAVRPGDIIVTPGHEDGQLYGHSGLIVAVRAAPVGPEWHHNLVVIHCVAESGGSGGVRRTDASLWRNRTVYYARPRFYSHSGVLITLGGLAAGFAVVSWLRG